MSQDGRLVVFVSYTSIDRAWAEWIAFTLEQAGHRSILQEWDFAAGENFVLKMQEALVDSDRTVAILSPDYLRRDFTKLEWTAVVAKDPTGRRRKLIPVRVRPCEPEGVLGPITYVDLVGVDRTDAARRLLASMREERGKPVEAPGFPGPPSGSTSESLPFERVCINGKTWTPDAATLVTMDYLLRSEGVQTRRLEVHVAFPIERLRRVGAIQTKLSIGCTAADFRLEADGAEFLSWQQMENDRSLIATRLSLSTLEWAVKDDGDPPRYLAGNRNLWASFRPLFPVQIQSRARPLDRVVFDERDRPLSRLASMAVMAAALASGHNLPELEDLHETIFVKT
jgi:hypothetical protein